MSGANRYAGSKWEARDFAGQFRQALKNILEVLKEANGKPEHIVRLTWYVLDKQEYLNSLKGVGEAYRELMGKHYPTMAVVQVSGLVEDEARLEIEATAVVPGAASGATTTITAAKATGRRMTRRASRYQPPADASAVTAPARTLFLTARALTRCPRTATRSWTSATPRFAARART